MAVAHGCSGVRGFLALAERYEKVCLDTTMVFTDFFDVEAPYPRALRGRLLDLRPKVLLGIDFPTIRIPTPTSSPGLTVWGWGNNGCRTCVGTTESGSSGNPFGLSARATYSGADHRGRAGSLVEPVEISGESLKEGLIGFDLGR